ncbi:MAG: hypothetical protein ACRD2R_08260, partial [Terriglobales bacterium]
MAKPGAKSIGCLTLLALLLAVNLVNLPNKRKVDPANRAAGDRIVRALEQCRKEKSVYPAELQLLVPAYVTEVPLVRMREKDPGRPFRYTALEDGKRFLLEYPEAAIGMLPSDAAYEYDSRTGAWRPKM